MAARPFGRAAFFVRPTGAMLAGVTSLRRRLLALLLLTPALLMGLAAAYGVIMAHLEGEERTFLESLQWASETLTTTGYGHDNHWSHPGTVGFVILTQLSGLVLTFVAFSLVVVPFFEARFEGRLPRSVPKLRDYVLVYRYGPAVSTLLEELDRAGVRTLVPKSTSRIPIRGSSCRRVRSWPRAPTKAMRRSCSARVRPASRERSSRSPIGRCIASR
jgi:hypothetical protein